MDGDDAALHGYRLCGHCPDIAHVAGLPIVVGSLLAGGVHLGYPLIAADGYYMHALDSHEQSLYVGIRSTFYRIATVAGQGLLVILAGFLEDSTGNIPLAWTVTMAILSALMLAASLYHQFILPHPDSDHPKEGVTARNILREFLETFRTFFTKPGALMAILFMLLYRLPEALLVKMVSPFLLDPVEQGGLALTTKEVGVAYAPWASSASPSAASSVASRQPVAA